MRNFVKHLSVLLYSAHALDGLKRKLCNGAQKSVGDHGIISATLLILLTQYNGQNGKIIT